MSEVTAHRAYTHLSHLFDTNLASPGCISTEMRRAFHEDGFVVMKGLLQTELLLALTRYAFAMARIGRLAINDSVIPGTPCAYGDPVMEELLWRLVPWMARVAGDKIHPTFSYFRIYRASDKLIRHRDRDACELSISLNLDQNSERPWPLWIQPASSAPVPVVLHPGDALLYKGIEREHWREPFQGKHCTQVFLHYVRQEGTYANQIFDGRKELSRMGLAAWSKGALDIANSGTQHASATLADISETASTTNDSV